MISLTLMKMKVTWDTDAPTPGTCISMKCTVHEINTHWKGKPQLPLKYSIQAWDRHLHVCQSCSNLDVTSQEPTCMYENLTKKR